MKETQINIIKTLNGQYRRWTGKQWLIYEKTHCKECGKELLRSKQDVKRFKQFFCCEICKIINSQKINDPLTANLLDRSSNFYYLIGLIVTDGWVQRIQKHNYPGRGYRITIQLQKGDIELLYELKNYFGGIVSGINSKYPKWTVYHFLFTEYLKNEVKITDNKTFTLDINKWFNTLTRQQQNSFMRGVIDGDGCIYFDKRHGDHHITISTASFNFVKTLFNYFSAYNPSAAVYHSESFGKTKYLYTLKDIISYIPEKNKYYVIRICGKKTIKILRELYKDVDDNIYLLHMKRKREKYLKIGEYYGLRNV